MCNKHTGFASGGVTCKLGALCFYSSSVLVDSFVLRNPPERKARKRWQKPYDNIAHNTTFLKIFSSYELRDLSVTQRKKTDVGKESLFTEISKQKLSINLNLKQ